MVGARGARSSCCPTAHAVLAPPWTPAPAIDGSRRGPSPTRRGMVPPFTVDAPTSTARARACVQASLWTHPSSSQRGLLCRDTIPGCLCTPHSLGLSPGEAKVASLRHCGLCVREGEAGPAGTQRKTSGAETRPRRLVGFSRRDNSRRGTRRRTRAERPQGGGAARTRRDETVRYAALTPRSPTGG